MAEFEPVIGLEVHVQLETERKIFSESPSGFGSGPNTQTDPTVLGLPGALPVFNKAVLDKAVRLGLAMGCTIRTDCRFARKHYFYPDSPKGYQISQYEEPLCEGGGLDFWLDGEAKRVGLIRIHLEEDAGKSTHHDGGYSLVDLNRCGVPLCEVVSLPELRSAREAAEYMRALRQLVRYLGISSGDMEKGHLRCDANVSLRPVGQSKLGTRTELKNINSFRFVENAIDHEIARQAAILERGGHIVQETRLWDADAGTSQAMRSKEEAEDYRYLPDPDLPPLSLTEAYIEKQRQSIDALPAQMMRVFLDYGLPLADALQLSADYPLASYFKTAVTAATFSDPAKPIANFMLSDWAAAMNRDNCAVADCPVKPEHLAALVAFIQDGTISSKIAKDTFKQMWEKRTGPETLIVRQISDEGELRAIAQTLIDANPGQRDQFRAGKDKLLGFFVGQLMKQTQGRANPELAQKIILELLKG